MLWEARRNRKLKHYAAVDSVGTGCYSFKVEVAGSIPVSGT